MSLYKTVDVAKNTTKTRPSIKDIQNRMENPDPASGALQEANTGSGKYCTLWNVQVARWTRRASAVRNQVCAEPDDSALKYTMFTMLLAAGGCLLSAYRIPHPHLFTFHQASPVFPQQHTKFVGAPAFWRPARREYMLRGPSREEKLEEGKGVGINYTRLPLSSPLLIAAQFPLGTRRNCHSVVGAGYLDSVGEEVGWSSPTEILQLSALRVEAMRQVASEHESALKSSSASWLRTRGNSCKQTESLEPPLNNEIHLYYPEVIVNPCSRFLPHRRAIALNYSSRDEAKSRGTHLSTAPFKLGIPRDYRPDIPPARATGMKGRGRREIHKKTRQPTASPGTIPTCENPVTQPGIEPGSPWWKASLLIAQPPWPYCLPFLLRLGRIIVRTPFSREGWKTASCFICTAAIVLAKCLASSPCHGTKSMVILILPHALTSSKYSRNCSGAQFRLNAANVSSVQLSADE
ncbi:hypothetical protein PR048_014828 [Dryococelus australis]|uniref:Uncharacterized protein n=1 Tax=Dryococelus australis TaxID=614101 RepID=A0ABQ9HF87_9NEOP|nr:hypothetical protein PR048_014828 [Dryococelus australis]